MSEMAPGQQDPAITQPVPAPDGHTRAALQAELHRNSLEQLANVYRVGPIVGYTAVGASGRAYAPGHEPSTLQYATDPAIKRHAGVYRAPGGPYILHQ